VDSPVPTSRVVIAAGRARMSRVLERPSFWYLASMLSVIAVCVTRIIKEPRFFFWDDTQLGAFGQWYGLGSRILAGDVTILSPGSWQGGNYLAEGQWGIWNPLTWLIALGAHAVGGATLYATAVKIIFLLVLATGTYLLARVYGAAPWWAGVAAFAASTGGHTIFIDSPSWVTGLQNVALFALCWWALKRHVDRGANPLLFFVFAYLLVTIGYVFGVIELAFLLIVMLVTVWLRGERAAALRVLILGSYSALLTVFVYLPGLLTSPVTNRAGSAVVNDQFLNLDLGDLATSPITTAVSSVRGYWGDLLPVPLQYVTWLLPLFVIFGLAAWRASFPSLIVPIVMVILTLAFVLGPSVLGPLRYPARMMPYLVLGVSVIFAVVASRGWPPTVGRARLIAVLALTAVSGWLAWAAQPASWTWVLLACTLQIVFLALVLLPPRSASRWPSHGVRAASLILVGSLLVLAPQIDRYPSSPLANFNVPSSVAAMREVADEMNHGIMTVGDVYSLMNDPQAYEESLLANLWYLTGKDAASVYTVLPFTTFAKELCVDLRGATCPEALDSLFSGSAVPLADDMALNTVVVIKGPGLDDEPETPEGWTLTEREFTWLLNRDDPVDRAGGVVRTTEGATVTQLAQDDLGVTLRVDDVDSEGGRVVFSRLAWPGYTTTGGRIGDPARAFLLTLDVTQEQLGEEIRIEFRPPGWTLEVSAALAAGALAVLWTGVFAMMTRRGRAGSAGEHVRSEMSPEDGAEALRERG
jgi:hypothetical protein